jgi:hypothetical protein
MKYYNITSSTCSTLSYILNLNKEIKDKVTSQRRLKIKKHLSSPIPMSTTTRQGSNGELP